MDIRPTPPSISLDLADAKSVDKAVEWAVKWAVGALNTNKQFVAWLQNSRHSQENMVKALDIFFLKLEGKLGQTIFPRPIARRFRFFGTSTSSTIILEILPASEGSWHGPFCLGFECTETRKSEAVRVTDLDQLVGMMNISSSEYEEQIRKQVPEEFVFGSKLGIEESEYFQFKAIKSSAKRDPEDHIRDDSSKYINAFCNHWGGYILWGINDDGIVEGCPEVDIDRLQKKLESRCSNIMFPPCNELVSVCRHEVQGVDAQSSAEKRFVYVIKVRANPGTLVLQSKPVASKIVQRNNNFELEEISPRDFHSLLISSLQQRIADSRIELSKIIPADYQLRIEESVPQKKDWISCLHTHAQRHRLGHPLFSVSQDGPSHCPTFVAVVCLHKRSAKADGSDKKTARHNAAQQWLQMYEGESQEAAESSKSHSNIWLCRLL